MDMEEGNKGGNTVEGNMEGGNKEVGNIFCFLLA